MPSRRQALVAIGGAGLLGGCVSLPGSTQSSDRQTSAAQDSSTSDAESQPTDSQKQPENNIEVEKIDKWNHDVEPIDGPPEAVVKRFYRAVYSNDVETANELLHPDAETGLFTEQTTARYRHADISISNVTSESVSDETVRVEYTLSTASNTSAQTRTTSLTLSQTAGKWRIM
jgi:hypothetical protein